MDLANWGSVQFSAILLVEQNIQNKIYIVGSAQKQQLKLKRLS